ncbi:hypothetical protein BGX38DRAFT_1241591 [Terfezia claveryi]|nr:hypothetical protein BGX38DRAFT_1241591 [Terfezia claveryi]
MSKERVTNIPLPQLSHASVVKYLGKSTDDNKVKREMLVWLWKAAVQPVLRELGFILSGLRFCLGSG